MLFEQENKTPKESFCKVDNENNKKENPKKDKEEKTTLSYRKKISFKAYIKK